MRKDRAEYRGEKLRKAHVDWKSLEKEVNVWGFEVLDHFGIRGSQLLIQRIQIDLAVGSWLADRLVRNR